MDSLIGPNEKALLDKYGQNVRKRYIEGLAAVKTTGRSEKSIGYVITNDGISFFAGAWFPAIDYGRGRSRAKSDTGFFNALKAWIVKKDSFSLSTKVDLNNATRSLQFKINKYGTKGNVFSKDRKILSSINIDDLNSELANSLGREWLTSITKTAVYESRFQFVDVKLLKK